MWVSIFNANFFRLHLTDAKNEWTMRCQTSFVPFTRCISEYIKTGAELYGRRLDKKIRSAMEKSHVIVFLDNNTIWKLNVWKNWPISHKFVYCTTQSLAVIKLYLINKVFHKIRSRTITTIQNNKTVKQK